MRKDEIIDKFIKKMDEWGHAHLASDTTVAKAVKALEEVLDE